MSTGPSASVRKAVVARDEGRCVCCGGRMNSIHHRCPRHMGGSSDERINSPENLLSVCGDGTTGCHGWIESHRDEAYEAGWLVHSWDDPETVPVRIMTETGSREFLLIDGERVPLDDLEMVF